MSYALPPDPHRFHIPVMGTGFTIDTPLRVARFGIHSVVSLGDDDMIEKVRAYHSRKMGIPYETIEEGSAEHRSRRISAYLNLLNLIVRTQVENLRQQPFEPGKEITRYFEMLPDGALKREYSVMVEDTNEARKARRQSALRRMIQPGRIDVNIMTKVDKNLSRDGKLLGPTETDALTGLKGFAESDLESSVIFSAGMNPRLYGSIANYADFFPDSSGNIKKQVVLKVSDYRSAEIQGRFLAKKGIWISEWRVESGLNCGGHAFATQGQLLGPILEEFKVRRRELAERIFPLYKQALAKTGRKISATPPTRFTVQGGIGTHEEQESIIGYYEADATGWGSPFLLVPEVVRIDQDNLEKVRVAGKDEIKLSRSSPLGIPFWNLQTSQSEQLRHDRIEKGLPGSPCPHKYLKFNTEFTEKPICRSSSAYQALKIREINAREDLNEEQKTAHRKEVTDRACICYDLSVTALDTMEIEHTAKAAVCVGPNATWFDKVCSLGEMIDHIYGRLDLLKGKSRPHMFVNELKLYVDYLAEEAERVKLKLSNQTTEYFEEFKTNLMKGIDYYRDQAEDLVEKGRDSFLKQLEGLKVEIANMAIPKEMPATS